MCDGRPREHQPESTTLKQGRPGAAIQGKSDGKTPARVCPGFGRDPVALKTVVCRSWTVRLRAGFAAQAAFDPMHGAASRRVIR